jgi:hypothetical protein
MAKYSDATDNGNLNIDLSTDTKTCVKHQKSSAFLCSMVNIIKMTQINMVK